MIKIVLKNQADLEIDYLKRMVPPLQGKINFLKLALTDLLSPAAIVVNTINFKEYKDFTGKIRMIVEEEEKYNKNILTESNYGATVSAYVNSTNNKLVDIDISKLIAFLDDLSAFNSLKLKEFLICPPDRLSQTNDDIKSVNSLNDKEIKIVCLAISYGIKALSDAAKGFFRKHNLVKICPYCNNENAEYKTEMRNNKKVVSRVHQLDHFFSQTDHPLLELCIYNLVPSGTACNSSTCKGQICFKDEFHLNPYIDGFNGDAMFVPIPKGLKTDRIELRYLGTPGGPRYMKIMGDDTDTSPDKYKKGNVNVFKLQGDYGGLTDKADFVLREVDRRLSGISSNLRFFKEMVGIDRGKSHKKWFKDQLGTSFDPAEFNDSALSKFNRDIHDFYVTKNPRAINVFLRDLIKYP